MKNQVFSVRAGEWKVALNGRILPAEWEQRGAALAGLEVERRRDADRTHKRKGENGQRDKARATELR